MGRVRPWTDQSSATGCIEAQGCTDYSVSEDSTTDEPSATSGTDSQTSLSPSLDESSQDGRTLGILADRTVVELRDESTGAPDWLDTDSMSDSSTFLEEDTSDLQSSYIWIANRAQGTVSKINTTTLEEEGRFYTRPDYAGNPQTTSVSLTGNVAVANSSGGLTKFYADHDDCIGLDTSSGPADLKSFYDDDCLAWYTPMDYVSQIPVAWTQGCFSQECPTVGEKVWTSGVTRGNTIEVVLVDGETGVIEETIPIPDAKANVLGIHSAVVDSEGNFWGSQKGVGSLVKVAFDTLEVKTWPMTTRGYGMAMDRDGYIWICSSRAVRFDPKSTEWERSGYVGASGGCVADGEVMWMAGDSLFGINRKTLDVEQEIELPEFVNGIGVDAEGYVWGVSTHDRVYRVDPETEEIDHVGGLVLGPYPHGDMTGLALRNARGSR